MKFKNLAQFYNSDELRNFHKKLISDRTNKQDGILYDEITGKPLIKKFDIVAHHKIPLTLSNVNDFSISLNENNVILISQETHNKEHSRFGYVTERKVYLVYGAPCSGKTTFVNSIKGNSDIIVDIDNIWQCITGKRYEKPKALNTNAFMLRDCLLDMIKTRAGKWERAFIIEGGAVKSDRERKLALYGAEPIYIDTDREECLKRLYGDCNRTREQKKEWEQYIDRWFNDYVPD